MTALAADRMSKSRANAGDRTIAYPVAASTIIYKGALVAVNTSGYAVPAATTAGQRVVGVAQQMVDNSTGSAGAKDVQASTGTYLFANDTDAVAQADVGRHCYVQDDQTVQDERGGSAVIAGLVVAVETVGVWVYVAPEASMFGAQFTGIETVTSGAISLYTRSSLISVTGTQAYTLADGLFECQRKTLRCSVAASTPDGTITPTTMTGGTSLDVDAVNECFELEWHDSGGWHVVGIVGGTIT